MNLQVSWLDLAIVLVYLLGVVGLGIVAGRFRTKGGEGSHYFLAGNSLTWPVIGLAMFAANISTVHLVSLAESAYTYGIGYTGNYEWMAGLTLVLLSLFFAPLYLRSKVATLPDFLERRFNRHCRDWLAVISLVSAIVIHMGIALYTAAWVLRGILGIPADGTLLGFDALMFFIVVLGLITGIYTLVGGLLAVVWTESFQTILLLVGAIAITIAGFWGIGGWHQLVETLNTSPHPLAGVSLPSKETIDWPTNRFLSMVLLPGDPGGLTWYGVLLGYPVIGIWYWCCDQTIVQRVLAARDEKHARLGPLFCAFIKVLPVFFFILPGVICLALVQKGYFAEGPASPRDAYTFMVTHMIPSWAWGLKGLVIAAMLAAAMQTCSAALNSTATLFAYDIYQRWRPATTDHQLVRIGKITTAVGTVLAIAASPIFSRYATLYEGLITMICYLAPPITAVFLVGVFWKGASGRAAFATMVAGAILGLVVFFLETYKQYTGWPVGAMIGSFGLCILCMVLLVVGSWAMPEPLKDEAHVLVWEDWRSPVRGPWQAAWLWDYRVLSVLVLLMFGGLYYVMR